MSNQYEGSAVAESDERIGVLAANNTAEQQNSVPEQMSSAQLLYSVVAHNVANPEKRITLSREQGKEIMKDFVDFVAGSSATPTTEDGRPKTFNEMDDGELLKCLSEFLGSGTVNTTINCGSIEAAQEAAELATMSDDELAELDNSSNPRVIAAKLRKAGIEAAQEHAERAQEQRMEERRAEWDAEMHDFGGMQLTGAQILAAINGYKKNRTEILQQLQAKYSNTDPNKIQTDVDRYMQLQELSREGKITSAQEQERKRLSEKDYVREGAEKAILYSQKNDANVKVDTSVSGDAQSTRQSQNSISSSSVGSSFVSSSSRDVSASLSSAPSLKNDFERSAPNVTALVITPKIESNIHSQAKTQVKDDFGAAFA